MKQRLAKELGIVGVFLGFCLEIYLMLEHTVVWVVKSLIAVLLFVTGYALVKAELEANRQMKPAGDIECK